MNLARLKGQMVEKNISQTKLAEQLSMSVQSLNAKLNGRGVFTLDEVVAISKILDLKKEVILGIFFEK